MIEHNLDVIRCADWIIDLGSHGGYKGGEIVVVGTPETVAEHSTSHTGRYLKQLLAQHPVRSWQVERRFEVGVGGVGEGLGVALVVAWWEGGRTRCFHYIKKTYSC